MITHTSSGSEYVAVTRTEFDALKRERDEQARDLSRVTAALDELNKAYELELRDRATAYTLDSFTAAQAAGFRYGTKQPAKMFSRPQITTQQALMGRALHNIVGQTAADQDAIAEQKARIAADANRLEAVRGDLADTEADLADTKARHLRATKHVGTMKRDLAAAEANAAEWRVKYGAVSSELAALKVKPSLEGIASVKLVQHDSAQLGFGGTITITYGGHTVEGRITQETLRHTGSPRPDRNLGGCRNVSIDRTQAVERDFVSEYMRSPYRVR